MTAGGGSEKEERMSKEGEERREKGCIVRRRLGNTGFPFVTCKQHYTLCCGGTSHANKTLTYRIPLDLLCLAKKRSRIQITTIQYTSSLNKRNVR